ncbi:MAG: hypothetical protein ACYTX0_37070, partial [Nostoc sp.]
SSTLIFALNSGALWQSPLISILRGNLSDRPPDSDAQLLETLRERRRLRVRPGLSRWGILFPAPLS